MASITTLRADGDPPPKSELCAAMIADDAAPTSPLPTPPAAVAPTPSTAPDESAAAAKSHRNEAGRCPSTPRISVPHIPRTTRASLVLEP
jgi:hypothetical protein